MADILEPFLDGGRFAYFSMEIALAPDIPTYSGGLGMLAGDLLRAAADLHVPFVAVTLVSHRGYFRQRLASDGTQSEDVQAWNPADHCRLLDAAVAVSLGGRAVWVAAWLYVLRGGHGGGVPVLLLDTDLLVNAEPDRRLTDHLYGGDAAYRLRQEAVLGIGGVRLLHALGFTTIHYHLNEGHSALLTVELVRRRAGDAADDDTLAGARQAVRRRCTFTTHTPVAAGHDRFSYEVAAAVLAGSVSEARLRRLAGGDELNMTQLALNLSGYVNGVARRHAETSQRMFPAVEIHAITNGIHGPTWVSPEFAALYDHELPRWRNEPEVLVRADCCLKQLDVAAAHEAAKRRLLEFLQARRPAAWQPDALTIGFARRMTAYKQPMLLFSDLARLQRLAEQAPLQIVYAGKAHPNDMDGKRLIRDVHAALAALQPQVPGVFLENFDMSMAPLVLAGVDLWLNTPQPPLEASGTSGMKAALNGVPSLSSLDGWWAEGHIEGVTGWAIHAIEGQTGAAEALYEALERKVLPSFANPDAWARVMVGAISKSASVFTAHRMVRRYVAEAYTSVGHEARLQISTSPI